MMPRDCRQVRPRLPHQLFLESSVFALMKPECSARQSSPMLPAAITLPTLLLANQEHSKPAPTSEPLHALCPLPGIFCLQVSMGSLPPDPCCSEVTSSQRPPLIILYKAKQTHTRIHRRTHSCIHARTHTHAHTCANAHTPAVSVSLPLCHSGDCPPTTSALRGRLSVLSVTAAFPAQEGLLSAGSTH